MFGSKNYEMRIQHMKESLDKLTEEKKQVEKELENARNRISDLEEQLAAHPKPEWSWMLPRFVSTALA